MISRIKYFAKKASMGSIATKGNIKYFKWLWVMCTANDTGKSEIMPDSYLDLLVVIENNSEIYNGLKLH